MIMKDNITVSEKDHALQQLMDELEKGRTSGEKEGWLTLEEVERHISEKTS